MANVMVYNITASILEQGSGGSDVVERRLSISVNNQEIETRSYAANAVDLGELKVYQDSDVVLKLVDVDDAGNISFPAIYTFKAKDTIAPSTPGSFGVNLLREE